jgi:FkbM family methyltransferase
MAAPSRGPLHDKLRHRYADYRLRQFLSPHVRAGQTVFDIGANEGAWTAALRGLDARVIAVEPQSACAAAMRERFGDDPQVEIVESAVGDAPGHGRLHLAVASTTFASMSAEWRQSVVENRGLPPDSWPESVEVSITTMETLIEEFGDPAFTKIDVEGFEAEVLAGLSRPLPALAFEFHQEMLEKVRRCVDRLAELGDYRYRVFVDEWPDRVGGEVPASEIVKTVADLTPGAWGMLVARRV